MATTNSTAQGTQAVDRAALLLALVVESVVPVSFTELAEGSGLARSTTSRLLSALERNHLVARDDDGNYLPGSMFVRYAARYDPAEQLVALCEPTLQRLRDITGETANLGSPGAGAVHHLAQVDSTYLLGTQDWTQVDVPLHVSALGQILLAFGALEVPAELPAVTHRSRTDPDELRHELGLIRRRGYAVTIDELEVGLTGLAAPLYDSNGVVAAIGISGPTARLESRVGHVGRLLVEQAKALSTTIQRRHPKEGAA